MSGDRLPVVHTSLDVVSLADDKAAAPSWVVRVAIDGEHCFSTAVHVSRETVSTKGKGVVHPNGASLRIDVLGRPATFTARWPRPASHP